MKQERDDFQTAMKYEWERDSIQIQNERENFIRTIEQLKLENSWLIDEAKSMNNENLENARTIKGQEMKIIEMSQRVLFLEG